MCSSLLIGLTSFIPFHSTHYAPKKAYHLLRKIEIPLSLTQFQDSLRFGGDVRVGDLQNNGELAFLVYRTVKQVDGGAPQPCFLGAFTMKGKVLWQKGSGVEQPNRPGPVAIYDIDTDGEVEVICSFVADTVGVDPFSLKKSTFQRIDGKTGTVEYVHRPSAFDTVSGKGPNWVHQQRVEK